MPLYTAIHLHFPLQQTAASVVVFPHAAPESHLSVVIGAQYRVPGAFIMWVFIFWDFPEDEFP